MAGLNRTVRIVSAIVLLCAVGSASAGLIDVQWNAGSSAYCVDDNWMPDTIPLDTEFLQFHAIIPAASIVVTFDDTCPGTEVSQLTLGDNARLQILPNALLTVNGDALVAGILDASGGTFTAPNAVFDGSRTRFRLSQGGMITFGGSQDLLYDLSGVWGAPWRSVEVIDGSLLDLSAVTTIDASFDDGWGGTSWHDMAAFSGSTLDLPGVETIIAPVRREDLFDVVVRDAGTEFDLTGLTTLDTAGLGYVRFNVQTNANLALPSLAGTLPWTIFLVYGGSTVDVGAAQPLVYDLSGVWGAPWRTVDVRNGSAVDLSTVTTIDASFDDGWGGTSWHDMAAFSGSTLDLSGVETIIAPVRREDLFDVVVRDAGTEFDLTGLTTLDTAGLGYVRFNVQTNANLALPSLAGTLPWTIFLVYGGSTVDVGAAQPLVYDLSGVWGAPWRTVDVRNGSAVDLSTVTTIDASFDDGWGGTSWHDMAAFSGSTLDLSGVETIIAPVRREDLFDVVVRDAGTEFDLTGLTTLDTAGLGYVRFNVQTNANLALPSLAGTLPWTIFLVYGGSTVDVGAAQPLVYDLSGVWGAPWRTVDVRNGSAVDLSTVTTIDASFDDGWGGTSWHDMAAFSGSTLDLSGVETIIAPVRREDLFDVVVRDAGTEFDLTGLTTLDTAGLGYVRFNVQTNANLALPSLAGTLPWTIFLVYGGSTVDVGAAQPLVYDLSGVWGAPWRTVDVRNGSAVDLSTVTTIDASFDDGWGGTSWHDMAAFSGSTLDLSGVETIETPQRPEDLFEIIADVGSSVALSSLRDVSGVGRFSVRVQDGATMTTGGLRLSSPTTILMQGTVPPDLGEVDPTTLHIGGPLRSVGVPVDIDFTGSALSSLELEGDLPMDQLITLNAAPGGNLSVGGHLSFEWTDESAVTLGAVSVRMNGDETQLLEVGGRNEGPIDTYDGPTDNNFGFGQLIVGEDDQATTVRLRDSFDNGNRLGPNAEALYLFGPLHGGPDGQSLRVLGGSTLVLDGIKLYYYDAAAGTWRDADALFPEGDNVVPFDNGFLQLVAPSDGIGFQLPELVATLAEPTSVGSANFDSASGNDIGLTELGPTSQSPGRFITLLNDGSGVEFAFVPTFVGIEPLDAAFGDFDGMNGPDAAVVNASDGTIFVLLNDGAGMGTFNVLAPIEIGGRPVAIAAGLLNGDGIVDLAVVDETGPSVTPYFGIGAGAFAAGTPSMVGSLPSALAIAQLDGLDGLDLAVANAGAGTITLLLGDGNGNFGSSFDFVVGAVPIDIDPRDVDRDKDIDLFVTNNGTGSVTLLLNNSAGGFTTQSVVVGDAPTSLVVDDFDVDGDNDFIVVAGTNGNRAARVFQNELMGGMPEFFNVINVVPDPFLQLVDTAPLNGDFLSDLIAVSSEMEPTGALTGEEPVGEVFVLLNVPPCFGDLNDDCQVEFGDLSELLGNWGPCADPEECPWDLDQDGSVGFLDLGRLLQTWGPCVLPFVPCNGDFDGGAQVGFTDLAVILGNWGTCPEDCPWDLDGSGSVGFDDLIMVLGNWGPCTSNPGGVLPCGG